MDKLELTGRRWFERGGGNTYFSALAVYNGKEIARIDFQYGYGDQWLYELCKLVVVNQYTIGDKQSPWQFIQFLESEGIAVFTAVQDVNRKKDL